IEILPEALEKLMAYEWPGNIRELSKVIERAVTSRQSRYLTPKHFDFSRYVPKGSEADGAKVNSNRATPTYKEQMLENEKTVLLSALEQTGWNQAEAARKLGIHR